MDSDHSEEDKPQVVKGVLKFPGGRKADEVSYSVMQQRYPSFKKIAEGQKIIQLDFEDAKISQNTVDRAAKDLFCREDGLLNKYIYQIETLEIFAYNPMFSNLNFIRHFFNYPKLTKIVLDCEYALVSSFLGASKGCNCEIVSEGFFTKKDNLYFIQCPYSLVDSGGGVEDQVRSLKIRVTESNFEKCLESFKKLTICSVMRVEIHSLKNAQEDFKLIADTIKGNMLNLQKLTFKIYCDEYVPHINKDEFENLRKLSYSYESHSEKQQFKDFLRKVQVFQQFDDKLSIDQIVEYNHKTLSLNFTKKLLIEEDLQDLNTFFSKINHSLTSVDIKFSDNQQIPLKYWVGLMNIFRTYLQLKTIIIKGSNVGPTICALCVAKLYKCKKTHVQIKQSSFIKNVLTFNLYQMYNHLLKVITDNIFELQDISEFTQVKSIEFSARSILGLTKGLSTFFKKTIVPIKDIKINVSSTYDIHKYLYRLIKDMKEFHQYCQIFSFNQGAAILFNSEPHGMRVSMGGIYDAQPTFSTQQLSKSLEAIINPFFWQVQHYVTDEVVCPFNKYLEYYRLYSMYRKLLLIDAYEKSQSPVMLAFYTIIGPFLPINPYQVYTDLFID